MTNHVPFRSRDDDPTRHLKSGDTDVVVTWVTCEVRHRRIELGSQVAVDNFDTGAVQATYPFSGNKAHHM